MHSQNQTIMVIVEPENTPQFEQQLQQAGNRAVFVDFYADWCGPCKAIAPTYQELSNLYSHAVFLKVNVDELDEVAQKYGVTAMPTFMSFHNSQKKGEQTGMDYYYLWYLPQ